MIRINTASAYTNTELTALSNGASTSSGFSAAFGIPAPIWGYGSGSTHPWVIIAPTNAPAYAFRPAGSTGALGWADGIVASTNISSALVLDLNSLAALVAATNAATKTRQVPSIASASGIVSEGNSTGTGGQWGNN